MLPLALAICGSLLQNSIQSQLPSLQGEPITMDEAVRLTIQNNPRALALQSEVAASRSAASAAAALVNPQVVFTPGFTRAGSDEELIISQPLEINGTRSARAGAARARSRAAEAAARLELGELVLEAKLAYLDVSRAQEAVALADDLREQTENLSQIASRQVDLGSRPGIERSQTAIEAARARQQATLAKAEYEAALAAMNTLIGRAPETPLQISPLAFAPAELPPLETLTEQALEHRAEVDLLTANREAFLQDARLARAEGLPDLAPHFRAASLTRSPVESGFGIGISIPLIDYGSRRNRIREAELSAQAEAQRLEAAQALIRQQVTQARARVQAAEDVVRSFEGGILDDARRVLEATLGGYRAGETSLTTVLEAQRTFRSVQAEYIEALASYASAWAELERATGAAPTTQLTKENKSR